MHGKDVAREVVPVNDNSSSTNGETDNPVGQQVSSAVQTPTNPSDDPTWESFLDDWKTLSNGETRIFVIEADHQSLESLVEDDPDGQNKAKAKSSSESRLRSNWG